MEKTLYRSRIDIWLWAVLLFTIAVIVAVGIGSPWWLTAIHATGILGIMVVCMFGCWYTIEGDTLSVYQFFRPHPMPIDKIKEVRYTTGFLAGPALSARRLSIKFTDRKVLRSSMPLEISPRDRDAFVRHLLRINPGITVIKGS